ncbi:MAG: hypothetical protein Q8M15_00300 [Bacteroidota bacterium]|nr:hypothetical protein [Bacteroidota bacterium]
MKKRSQILNLLICIMLFTAACKKDNPLPQPVVVETPKCFIKKVLNETNSQICDYNNQNKLIRTIDINGTDSVFTDFEYIGKVVTLKNPKTDLVQTFYLNNNGYADSATIYEAGKINIKIKMILNAEGYLIEQRQTGTITFGGTYPINEINTIEYLNGNAIKITTNNLGTLSIVTYEYYADKINYSAPSEEAQSFIKSNKKLLKKFTNEDGTFMNYLYLLDNNGKVMEIMKTNQANKVTNTFNTWFCK